MKVSELWLREWVDPSLSIQELAAQLTMAGLEVEGIAPVAGQFDHVVVAHVLKTKPHPDASKLTICEIDDGSGVTRQVVCGAANVRAGLNVALALPGAHLPGEIHIKEAKLRGELSQGMLCSYTELGLEESAEGIMELAEDAPIGTSLHDYLLLFDHILDISLTPNRADCFSVLGIAREIAAINSLRLNSIPMNVIEPTHDEQLAIDLKAPLACPQYYGRVIRSINPNATTPVWMKERLRRGGMRAVHPVVDVTNYVTLELGQPMHAFDLAVLSGKVQVRYAAPNEKLMLLDGQEVELSDKVLVVADLEKPLAIAGVMGGDLSAVNESTTDIFLESAFFNPLVVSGVARRYGINTDASQRFERGVDPTLQKRALERATELLEAIVGGDVGPVTMALAEDVVPKKVTITFNPSKVKQLSSLEIDEQEMSNILERLGMTVVRNQALWQVGVPMHRFDLTLDVDLVEEIIRLYGYDNLAPETLRAPLVPGEINRLECLSRNVSMFLSHRGYHEAINYSFVDPELQEVLFPGHPSKVLLNPISSELSAMRISLWPGLIAAMVYNMHRQQPAMRCFEVGVVFDVSTSQLTERPMVAGLLTGEHGLLNWSEPDRFYDFYDVKGDLEAMFGELGLKDIRFVKGEHPALHPGQSAILRHLDQDIGFVGALHPRLLDALEIASNVFLFELALRPLMERDKVVFKPISKYPQIRRDLSFLVNHEVSALQIETAVQEVVAAELLKSFDVFDIYTGDKVPADKKSVAIALTLQDEHRTLIDSQIETIIGAIIKKLVDEFNIMLRN